MNNPRYYNLKDKKSASVNKPKQTFTAEIRALCNEMNNFIERNPHMNKNSIINTTYDISSRAYELANFAYYHLRIYTNDEMDYIESKINQAIDNAKEEIYKND